MKDAKEDCTNSISSRKYEKRKVGKVNKSIKRKSVRIAEKREFEANFMPNDADDEKDPEWQVTSSSRKKVVAKTKVSKTKIEYFEEAKLIFNVSFSSPDNCNKKLYISYWS